MIKLLLPLLLIPTSVAAGLIPVTAVARTASMALTSAAKAVGVPTKLLKAVCWVESHHNSNIVSLSDGGSPSYGLCQIKLNTVRWLGYTGTSGSLLDPDVNANWAARYLKYQYVRYGGDWVKAVSAYNAGHSSNNTRYIDKVFNYALR